MGATREAADELDEIVNDVMKRRQEKTWRVGYCSTHASTRLIE